MRHLNFLRFLLGSAGLAAASARATEFSADAGASYFWLHHGQYEAGPQPFARDEPGRWAPYVALNAGFTPHVGLRFAYHYLREDEAVVAFGSPPGNPPSPLTMVVFGHYRDRVHLASLSPEFSWRAGQSVSFAIAPLLNWVASKGVVSYSTTSPLLTLVAPRERNATGFTLGAAARIAWALSPRWALTASYQYVDLDPSFGRRADALLGGMRWTF